MPDTQRKSAYIIPIVIDNCWDCKFAKVVCYEKFGYDCSIYDGEDKLHCAEKGFPEKCPLNKYGFVIVAKTGNQIPNDILEKALELNEKICKDIPSTTRSCEVHIDCDLADDEAKQLGKTNATHCYYDSRDNCFKT